MPSLAETQSLLRQAIVGGETTAGAPLLVGGADARTGLAIHRRHYETSLVTALLGRFPATAWLVGTPFLEESALAFVHERPPHGPCIAEYGVDVPEFLALHPGATRVPYLREFAELEWTIGIVSIAIAQPALPIDELSNIDPMALPDVRLTLQSGLRLLDVAWPIDDLMKLYLTDTAPDQLVLEPAETWIQVHGGRGAFHIERLSQGDFLFRHAVADGHTIGDAAAYALETVSNFDPGQALSHLFASRLVTAVVPCIEGERK